jgi:hypothetical protein
VATVVGKLNDLAHGIQARRVEEQAKPPRAHGASRQRDNWLAGYLAGVCAALAQLTGGNSEEIERRVVAEVST